MKSAIKLNKTSDKKVSRVVSLPSINNDRMRYKNYLTELKIKSPSKPKDEIEKVKLKLKNPTEILKEFDELFCKYILKSF